MPAEHSPEFKRVRDRIIELSEEKRTRFARFFGALLELQRPLGAPARDVFRAIAELDDDDLERLAGWFAQHVNRWDQFPRDSSHGRPGYAYSAEAPKRMIGETSAAPLAVTLQCAQPAQSRPGLNFRQSL